MIPKASHAPSCLAKVRAHYLELHSAERRIADIVLEHPHLAVSVSVNDLARRVGVAGSTVVRFCKTLGYAGFQELRRELADDLARPSEIHGDITPADDPGTIARKILAADRAALEDTLGSLDDAAIAAAVDALAGAGRIDIYGVGSSGPIAVDAFYRLFRIGMPVHSYTDSHMMAVAAGQLSPGDVAFAISHTGSTRETLEATAEAKRVGATTICLTSFAVSPIAQLADILLVTACRETTFRQEAMASRIAQLSMVDALYAAVAVRTAERSAEALSRSNLIIQAKRQVGGFRS